MYDQQRVGHSVRRSDPMPTEGTKAPVLSLKKGIGAAMMKSQQERRRRKCYMWYKNNNVANVGIAFCARKSFKL